MSVEPIPDERAAVARTGSERLLVIADYHAGIESVLRVEGVELDSQAQRRRERVLGLLAETDADRLVILGDLIHAVGDPWDSERDELRALFDALAVPVTLVKGNHDGEIEGFVDEIAHPITVTEPQGTRIGSLGFVHGHTWPSREVLEADIVCQGHEHPVVRLEDSVGGGRMEHVWLRGQLAPEAFADAVPDAAVDGELVVFPVFNDRSGGTWINVEGQEFLSPFLPEGIDDGEAYLLDGTRLGPYRSV
ncbi:phosphoesterase [Halovenus sp. WSH3]|uniref:Phosphoesterase n=1 Tax=Halovenus carboxidivorans TaxID=2692199 RepID=A0A6B0T7R2_9EURY|nr:metallophosphoesterase [Halovenus carboxidivorans]MXR50930.1 phosphoesterase [Halovenus carboxidivorans]